MNPDDPVIREGDQDRTDNVQRFDSDTSDAALVIAIGRYQQAALAEAYRRHAGAVFGLARRLLNDQARAEDIVQEVFVRLWNQPDRFDPDRGSLRSYLLTNAHGRAIDLIRSDSSRRKREEREAREISDQANSGYDISHEVWDMALAGHVREALDALSEGERQAIELAYFGGRTYREVADELGVAEGTIKSRIRSGLKRLRAELSDAGITDSVGGV